MQTGNVCEEHCLLFEKLCREKLLNIPDKAVLKAAVDYAKGIQQTFENKDKIIDHWHHLYLQEKVINETRMEVMKEYLSNDAYNNIKKETKKRIKNGKNLA